MPFYALSNAGKWDVEGYSFSVRYELACTGVDVVVVGPLMELLFWAVVGGLFGTALIDIVHKNIIESSPLRYEVPTGWIFHYLIGAGVGLTYPLFYLAFDVAMPVNHLIPGLLWGLATTLLRWLTNFPAFGWGFFGVRAPKGTKPLIAPARV